MKAKTKVQNIFCFPDNLFAFFIIILLFGCFKANAQAVSYDLQYMVKSGNISTVPAYETRTLEDSQQHAITTKGIVWLKGIQFTDGIIDIDLRGKDVFLQSFLGIAFHGTDTSHCDIIYFRPFNFRHADSTRWKWSLAYMQIPEFNFARLRKEHPGVYENRIVPPPLADQWFHATILIQGNHAAVYVNHQAQPALAVTLLDGRRDGMLGLYSDGLTGDFANLLITNIQPGLPEGRTQLQEQGVQWLKDISFDTGTIELDLRGRNQEGQSFLGVAFGGIDSTHCEVLYFRPFNFESSDGLKRMHMVQYMSLPDYDWSKLRKSRTGEFEKQILTAPHPNDWFHAKIVVQPEEVEVFVNYSSIASLHVKRFHSGGKLLGFWSNGLPADFANLIIQVQ